jgi:excinuclease ABC subunit A
MHEFSSAETLLDLDFARPIYVVVDRLAIGNDMRSRLIDSVEICYREGRGEAILEFVAEATGGEPERMVFNERFECKTCGAVYQEPEPRLFSFNSPYGACPRCQGFGNTVDFDINLVIPDGGKSLNEGAIQPWTTPRYRVLLNELKKFARAKNIPVDLPFRNLTSQQQNLVIEGEPRSG